MFLLTFDSKVNLLNYLEKGLPGEGVGALYLAHGNTSLEEYENFGKQMARFLLPTAYINSSFFFEGRGECTVLLGSRKLR